jgi:Cu/Ag efflux pump CusA
VIERQNVSRYVDVAGAVEGRDRDDVVSDVERRLGDIHFPLEYHAEVLAAETQPTGRLISIALAAALGILLLLQAFLGTWRLAFLCLLTIPLGLTGGVLAALAAGGTLSLGSYIALFAVFGFAARASLLLCDRIGDSQRREREPTGAALVVRSAREQLVPAAMTALATAAVFGTVLIGGSGPGYELLRPAAAVVLGGLLTSLPLTLFVLPILYVRFGFAPAAEAARASEAREEPVPEAPARFEPGS